MLPVHMSQMQIQTSVYKALDYITLCGLQVVAVNGCADTVSVVCRDAGLLERGHQVRRRGANLAIADFFDAGTDCISNHGQEVSQIISRTCPAQIYIGHNSMIVYFPGIGLA